MNKTIPFDLNQRSIRENRSSGRDLSIVVGSAWMVGITLLLFFLPAVNGFIGGLVGGYKVGSLKRALTAALIPAVAAAIGLWIIIAMFNAPVLGFFAGVAVTIMIVLSEIGLFIGAAVGGIVREKRTSMPGS